MKIAIIVVGLVLLVAFIYRIIKRGRVSCETCPWTGEEKDLDAYRSEDSQSCSWHFYCPACGSSKLSNIEKRGAEC